MPGETGETRESETQITSVESAVRIWQSARQELGLKMDLIQNHSGDLFAGILAATHRSESAENPDDTGGEVPSIEDEASKLIPALVDAGLVTRTQLQVFFEDTFNLSSFQTTRAIATALGKNEITFARTEDLSYTLPQLTE